MTRYDIAMMCGYNSVEEYDEAEMRNNEIFFEGLNKQKPYVEKEPVKIQPVNQWISVKDKLPEVGKLVIVCGKQGGVGAMELLSNGKWYSNGMAWSAEWIVYWQPLPEPPKDGDTK